MKFEELEAVKQAVEQKKVHLILLGPQVSEAIKKSKGLDADLLFNLRNLRYLRISQTCLSNVPDGIGQLTNLTILQLHANEIEEVSNAINNLTNLQLFDCSFNKLKICTPLDLPRLRRLNLASNLLSRLSLLRTNVMLIYLNLANNLLKTVPNVYHAEFAHLSELHLNENEIHYIPPTLSQLSALKILNLADNKFETFPDVCYAEFACLSELYLNRNEIEYIPPTINQLSALKVLNLESNLLIDVPKELADCGKLENLNLRMNTMYDQKLNDLCSVVANTKKILEYLRSSEYNSEDEYLLALKQIKRRKEDLRDILKIERVTDDAAVIKVEKNFLIKIRPFIAACILKEVNFTKKSFRKFIQLQTKLLDGVCKYKQIATIAIHDMASIACGNLTYTTKPPEELNIKPLPRNDIYTGKELFEQLKKEEENVCKITNESCNKRYTFLNSLQGSSSFPCLMDSREVVISFPPIVSSNVTKVSLLTKSVFVEVTSTKSNIICRRVLNEFLKELMTLGLTDLKLQEKNCNLIVQQVRVEDANGTVMITYPSPDDLKDLCKDYLIIIH